MIASGNQRTLPIELPSPENIISIDSESFLVVIAACLPGTRALLRRKGSGKFSQSQFSFEFLRRFVNSQIATLQQTKKGRRTQPGDFQIDGLSIPSFPPEQQTNAILHCQ
jgi:hypothetical protein